MTKFKKITKIIFQTLIINSMFIFITFSAWGAPSELNVIPASGTQVDLSWRSIDTESYDVWQSPDGINWTKIATTDQGQYSYSVITGVEPYKNYYFLVSVKDSVNNPLTDANETNSTRYGVTFPPDKDVHNYYQADTNLCANCHSTHQGVAKKMLLYPSTDDTCITCHDGSQSKYNVLEGTVSRDGTWESPLESPAGPYGSLLGRLATAEPESVHTIGQQVYGAPGGNPTGTGEEWTEGLSCASCHDPHFTPNYRLLTVTTPDNTNVSVTGFAYTDLTKNMEVSSYVYGTSEFCSGCHKDYLAGGGAGSTPAAGTYQSDGMFRHGVGISPDSKGLQTILPLEGTARDNTDRMTCLTCHRAHGSTAVGNWYKYDDPDGGGRLSNKLLRLGNNGVCAECHKK
ncbi:MAG: cytochrome c3 family protein [Bacillota bacterium]